MRTAETELFPVAGNPGRTFEAKDEAARVSSEALLMVGVPNDSRGRVSEGRWVVTDEVEVEVVAAIWSCTAGFRRPFPTEGAERSRVFV